MMLHLFNYLLSQGQIKRQRYNNKNYLFFQVKVTLKLAPALADDINIPAL